MSEQTDNAIDATIAPIPSPGEQFFPKFTATPELEAEARDLISQYPEGRQQSAVLPILHVIQHKFGFVSADAMEWTAKMIGTEPVQVLGIVTFYPGLRQMCPGKWHIRICRTIACAMGGGEELFTYACKKLNIDPSTITPSNLLAVSPNGLWSIEQVECLANCGFGPNMMVNDNLYDHMTPEKFDQIVAEYEQKQN